MDIIDRLFEQLVQAVERSPGGRESVPTIGEIYQHLIPYRALRNELGIWELAEYEHALVRLLAGERGYLKVQSEEVATELRRELTSPSPILGIYRDYAGVRVEILGAPELPTLVASSHGVTSPEPAPAPLETQSPCVSCGALLPRIEGLRYCPACGGDQLVEPCSDCGQALKAEWNFCIRCGTPRDGGERRPRAVH